MDETTARLGLPMLHAGQAQKEMTHNEALVLIDLLLAGSVEEAARNDPPDDPLPGQCWIVGDDPRGEWREQAGRIAGWTAGGWRFVAPREGMGLAVAGSGIELRWRDGAWRSGELHGAGLWVAGERVVGARQPVIASAEGGSVIDIEARATVTAIITALKSHGLIG